MEMNVLSRLNVRSWHRTLVPLTQASLTRLLRLIIIFCRSLLLLHKLLDLLFCLCWKLPKSHANSARMLHELLTALGYTLQTQSHLWSQSTICWPGKITSWRCSIRSLVPCRSIILSHSWLLTDYMNFCLERLYKRAIYNSICKHYFMLSSWCEMTRARFFEQHIQTIR